MIQRRVQEAWAIPEASRGVGGTIYFPLTLSGGGGVTNPCGVGREEPGAESLLGAAEVSILIAASCFVFPAPRGSCWCRARRGSTKPGQRDAGPTSLRCVSPPPRPTPPPIPPSPLQALKIIYVCKLLLIHMSYSSCLPTGLGMGEFSNRQAGKSGRQRKEHPCEVRSPGVGSQLYHGCALPSLPRPLVPHLQMRGWL